MTITTDATQVSYQPPYTGSSSRVLQGWLADQASVKDFGAVGDGVTDDTAGFNAAFAALAANQIAGLYLPSGTYIISSSITVSANTISGWNVFGAGRGKTVIMMTGNNLPVFNFSAIGIMHSCTWHDFTIAYQTVQAGHTASAAFFWTGAVSSSPQNNVFNCGWEGLIIENAYYMFSQNNALVWGCYAHNIFVESAGSVSNLTGAAGQPRNSFDMYIKGVVAGEVAFKHNAMVAEYFVEMNSCNGGVLSDGSGGTHIFRHLALENATLSQNTTLFYFPNSIIIGTYIYANTLAVNAGVTVTVFSGGDTNGRSQLDVDLFTWSFAGGIAAQGAGATVNLVNFSSGTGRMARFGTLEGEFSAYASSPVCQLYNYGGSVTGQFIDVRDWTTTSKAQIVSGGTATLSYSSPQRIVFGAALTAPGKVLLPVGGSNVGQNMFEARTFNIVKMASAGTSQPVNIYDSTGTVLVATMPASAAGIKTIRFYRVNPDGVTTGLGFYIADPAFV